MLCITRPPTPFLASPRALIPLFVAGAMACSSTRDGAGTSDGGPGEVPTSDAGPTIGNGDIVIEDMGLHEVRHGTVFRYEPTIRGEVILCRKDMGHDDVRVDSESGAITWDTSALAFGRGFHIRIKCSNYDGHVFASLVVHVDKTGSSRLRVAGAEGVSPYIGVGGRSMQSGDTLVIPDGVYPVSVSADESYENAFKSTSPTAGLADQFTTVIARSPGGVVVSGAAQEGIPQQKNAFQLDNPVNVAIVGFVAKDVLRESFFAGPLGSSSRVLVDFMGTQGAGTEHEPCGDFAEASRGACSKAGFRINGGQPLIQNSYDWGHNRYGIMTRSSTASVTRRSFVRLDEHRGDQPYGGFSNYCDTAHISQDNTVFDSLAIAAPHYKNYAGLEAYPATGCEQTPATLRTEGLLSVHNALSLSLMDQKAGPNHVWDHIVSFDSEGTCTPQTNRCGAWLLQADKETDVSNSFFGTARGFEGTTSVAGAFNTDVALRDGVAISDVPGVADQGQVPRYLPESLLYFRGRSDTFHGDPGSLELTTTRRYPIAGEDIIAANMRSYRNAEAMRVGGGTVDIDGNRGATAQGESMSEYFWGYVDEHIPPLVVRVKEYAGGAHRIAWERHVGPRRDLVTGWRIICTSRDDSEVAELAENQLAYLDDSPCDSYGVQALYADGESGIAYSEGAE